MTRQKTFKRRIRERMERTGESYVSARAALIDDEPPGVHPETTALRFALQEAGLEISEALALIIAGGAWRGAHVASRTSAEDFTHFHLSGWNPFQSDIRAAIMRTARLAAATGGATGRRDGTARAARDATCSSRGSTRARSRRACQVDQTGGGLPRCSRCVALDEDQRARPRPHAARPSRPNELAEPPAAACARTAPPAARDRAPATAGRRGGGAPRPRGVRDAARPSRRTAGMSLRGHRRAGPTTLEREAGRRPSRPASTATARLTTWPPRSEARAACCAVSRPQGLREAADAAEAPELMHDREPDRRSSHGLAELAAETDRDAHAPRSGRSTSGELGPVEIPARAATLKMQSFSAAARPLWEAGDEPAFYLY